MIASILSALSFALMAGAFVIIHLRVTELEKDDTSKRVDNLVEVAKAHDISISEMDKDLDKLEVQSSYNEEAINKIIKQLEDIAEDIKRLDALEQKVEAVAKSEKEIRSYYINFREPKNLPVYNAGVPWAKDFKCMDDSTDADKIQILRNEADAYRWQLSHENMNTEDRMVTLNAYSNCLRELRGYTDKEKNNE